MKTAKLEKSAVSSFYEGDNDTDRTKAPFEVSVF